MTNMFQVTDCPCQRGGWCERHQCEKSPLLWQLCQRNSELFAMWERGAGPGQFQLPEAQSRLQHPCVHLGEQARLENCVTCRGNIALKVFRCAIFGECTLGKRVAELAVCTVCDRYDPPFVSPPSGSPSHAS